MSAETSSKPDVFKTVVIILLTLISIFAAMVTFLQGYASLQAEGLIQGRRGSQISAVNSTGLSFTAGLDAAHGVDVQERYADYIQRAIRADTKARALRMGGGQQQIDLAAEYALDAERWNKAADQVTQSNPLLSEYGQDADLYQETLSREGYLENERQHTLLDQARAWSRKANGYVAILSTLSVSLFLAGLSLTLSSRVRYLLAAAAIGLTLVCFVWLLFVLFSPVPKISEDAIQKFVDGQIKYNVSIARGEDPIQAITDFDAAVEMAPDYGRAYFYRSLANTDSRLTDIHLDLAKAIADGERALALGVESSPVYGNLGWLYYLNGQYNNALAATEKALTLSPDDCYLPFNHGLTLAALQRQSEAEKAYTEEAIPCALKQGDFLRNYYLDVGVTDLQDLQVARPDLVESLEPSRLRLKEALASLRLFGDTLPRPTSATIGSLTFGEDLDDTNHITQPADEFPQSTLTVYASLDFSSMTPETHWLERWLLDGREYFALEHPSWDYDESGTEWIGVTNAGGLASGHYEVDIFVEGNLMTTGEFTVQPGPLPPMTSHQSTNVGVTINYPLDWNVTELADNEVSVVAARDPYHPNFFGVTAWVASTGTDDDVLALFDGYMGALKDAFSDVTSEQPEPFTVAGLDGWLEYYTYTDAQGIPIQGAAVGVLDQSQGYVYLLAAESHADEWDSNVDLYNVMLSRISIGSDSSGQLAVHSARGSAMASPGDSR